ncbi:MAG: hypothetical protein M5U28_14110 [Sandaracinaceae bacterium]|nr:hypothetical protein [Sandaracinaceae bacterium]
MYVKAMVVIGPAHDSALARVAHPPIDSILLASLGADARFDVHHRRAWRATRWTTLDEASYFALIETLRAAGLDEPAFWMIERYWRPDRERT